MCTNYRPTSRELVKEYFGNGLQFKDMDDWRAEFYPGHVAPIIRPARHSDSIKTGWACSGAIF